MTDLWLSLPQANSPHPSTTLPGGVSGHPITMTSKLARRLLFLGLTPTWPQPVPLSISSSNLLAHITVLSLYPSCPHATNAGVGNAA